MESKVKRQNLKPPGKCAFCGGGDLSKEHVYPNWLNPYIARMFRYTTHFVSYGQPGGSGSFGPGKMHRQGDPHSKQLRVVCRPCNNGWMSRLQEQAKDILLPLIHGETDPLGVEEKLTIARWVMMSVMIHEFSDPRTQRIVDEERRSFKDDPTPNSDWVIWCGRASDEISSATYNHFCVDIDAAQVSNGGVLASFSLQTTGFTVGKLFVHTFSSRKMTIDPDAFARRFDGNLTVLWPIRPWSVLPERNVSLEDFYNITEAVRNRFDSTKAYRKPVD